MTDQFIVSLLYCYGFFLILCGITAVIFIGSKAKTALVSGGFSGVTIIIIAYLWNPENNIIRVAGLVVTIALLAVFAWRSSKTLFTIFSLIKTGSFGEELNKKGIAFLIISLMAIVSVFTIILQLASILH